jgi:hypothetical protein
VVRFVRVPMVEFSDQQRGVTDVFGWFTGKVVVCYPLD